MVKRIPYSMNLVTVCVDSVEGGVCKGGFWTLFDDAPRPFEELTNLVQGMDAFFDEINFPQRSMAPKSFQKGNPVASYNTISEKEAKMSADELQEKRGDKGTFIVQVQYRQNATWQGKVIWADENKEEHFRSALELIKMIDSALTKEGIQ